MGFFITFEGIEGCGKSTQITLLANGLTTAGYRVLLTREPGGCPIADKIRAILLDADNREICPLSELFLYAAARAQHVSEVILPALKSDTIVLCDRYTDATIAYQNCGRGLERSTIDLLSGLACGALLPDLTVLIDCEVAVGLQRAKSRIEAVSGPREERFELEALEFHQRVRNGYLDLAKQEPKRFVTIDGNNSIGHISETIMKQVFARIQGTKRAIQRYCWT